MTIVYCNKSLDIKFIAHDAFLERPSSDTLKIERLERQMLQKCLGANKNPKGHKHDIQNRLRSPLRGE